MRKIAVIGGGIIGVTSAAALAEAGHAVTIFSRDPHEKTTSWTAGAVIYPVNIEESERMLGWFAANNARLESLRAAGVPGISWIDWMKCSVEPTCPVPGWLRTVKGAGVIDTADCPYGMKSGIRARILHIDVDAYYPHMIDRFRHSGGAFVIRNIPSFADVPSEFDTVVNCAGVYASQLTADDDLHPARGQIVIVRDPGLTRHYSTFDSKNYIYPRGGGRCVLGGSYENGAWDVTPDDALTRAIIAWAAEREPSLKNAEILDVRVGLRPVRSSVRLEKESVDGRTIIHNYGHGGCGYTLAWGCAEDIVKLV